MSTPHSRYPRFEDVVTKEWFDAVISNGAWDPTHGSPLDHWIDDLKNGALGNSLKFPPHLEKCNDTDVLADPEFKSVLHTWLRVRYEYVVSELNATNVTKIGRRMSVDADWPNEIKKSIATTGIYWGSLPLDTGSFWYDDNKPVHVYLEASISHDTIDWVGTIRARIDYLTGDEEREIRLKEETFVIITRLDTDGNTDDEMVNVTASTGKSWERPFMPGSLSI